MRGSLASPCNTPQRRHGLVGEQGWPAASAFRMFHNEIVSAHRRRDLTARSFGLGPLTSSLPLEREPALLACVGAVVVESLQALHVLRQRCLELRLARADLS